MSAGLLWVVVAAVLGIAEIFTLTLVLGLVALAAGLAAIVAFVGGGPALQVAAFVAAGVALLGLVRPVARRHRRTPAALRTGVDALIGARGVVLERVDDTSGRVKIAGEVWTARPYLEAEVIEPGARVEVASIQGATALVYEAENPWKP